MKVIKRPARLARETHKISYRERLHRLSECFRRAFVVPELCGIEKSRKFKPTSKTTRHTREQCLMSSSCSQVSTHMYLIPLVCNKYRQVPLEGEERTYSPSKICELEIIGPKVFFLVLIAPSALVHDIPL